MISSFAPIINKNAETLILGTMPGAMSLLKQEYYGHPQNAFWKIMFSIFDKLPVSNIFQEKANLLLKNKIALWDVLQHCERKGSLDIHIKNQIENDFDSLFVEYPRINRILFNGKESHKYFIRKFGQIEGISYHVMPSTSPANTIGFQKKLDLWSEVLK